MKRIDARLWPTYTEHAAPESIAAHIEAAETERRSLDRYITELRGLQQQRTAQIAAGTWPTNEEQQ